MTHLSDDQIAAAAAGLDLEGPAADHLEGCVTCRTEIAAFERLIADRRGRFAAEQPDWERQAAAVMARIPAAGQGSGRHRPGWLRPVLALAAAVVLAVAVGLLRTDRRPATPAAQPSVEEVLAEMNELLSDDRIPGFEVIDPGIDELTADIDNGAS
ncbi:MAG: hypothetical protein PVG53_01365 [Holophagae bacterium]|jgi:hypothetical protein